MATVLEYRGCQITEAEVSFIEKLMAAEPQASRRALSRKLCAAWGWVQPNGYPRDMVCRGLLLALDRGGWIQLPPARWVAQTPPRRLVAPAIEIDTRPLRKRLAELDPMRWRQVRRTEEEPLFNGLIQRYHYLGYTRPVGEHLKYLVYAGDRPVACFAWSSAPRHLGPRDRFLGWSPQARRRNIGLVAYNTRFLILPWVEVPYLASHLLARMVRMLSAEWEQAYGHAVHFAETFVDPARFRGTCYRAANWIWLGRTTGRGKDDRTNRPHLPCKDVLGYPLRKDFRERLSEMG